MIFVYPKELQPGDKLRIVDPEAKANKVFWEEVDSITVPAMPGAKVMVFTKARMIMCDPGDKVTVQRDVEQSVGE
jgi:hypothetical protein